MATSVRQASAAATRCLYRVCAQMYFVFFFRHRYAREMSTIWTLDSVFSMSTQCHVVVVVVRTLHTQTNHNNDMHLM